MGIRVIGDVLKVWLYAAASLLLGACLSPWLYDAGKALVEVCSFKQINGPVDRLADFARARDFPQFYEISLIFAAILLFLPLIESLRFGRGAGPKPWLLRVAENAEMDGQRLQKNPHSIHHFLRGFLLVTGLFILIGAAFLVTGRLTWQHPAPNSGRWLLGMTAFSLLSAAVQEIFYRGIALGLFLRAMGPIAALGSSAALFALWHFLFPHHGMTVPDTEAAGIGFELLRQSAGQLFDIRAVLGLLVPLLALGGLLALARWRTASLWLPVGLHAGWIFAHRLIDHLTAGSGLRHGAVAFSGILITAFLIEYLAATDSQPPQPHVTDAS